ncbi:mitochondrial intermediate peptidase isoform X1 [Macrobrachium rosenbergii]|uniref:mitochondrial intermediate peptidase isoform X1 n=2 Tax=Macrobrachium rosenbergii TaxID=79674 RepID=UPI0034D54EE8
MNFRRGADIFSRRARWRTSKSRDQRFFPVLKLNDMWFRYVNTWSPLASAFNTKPNKLLSLQFAKDVTGLFGVPELREPEGFYLLKENAIHETHYLVAECCSPSRSRKMVEVFDHLSDTLCRVADLAEFIRMAHPQARYSHAAEDACIAIGGLVEQLNTHRQLYDALLDVVKNGDTFPTSDVDQHVGKLFLFDFEQSGIHLDESKRRRVVSLNESILTLGQHFMNGTLQPRAIPKSKLPENIRQQFAIDGDNIVVTGLYADAHMEITREAAYKIFLYPDRHQESLLTDLLCGRHEMATTCGFPSYAHRAVKGSLAETPELVQNFLNLLSQEVRPRAEEDFAEMGIMKMTQNKYSKSLAPWDVPYFTGQARQNKFNLNTSELAPYLSLGAVMDGLNRLLNSLYDVVLEVEEPKSGELWASDVYKVAVKHSTEGLLGYIYCDFYERPGKAHQDCHFTIRGGKLLPDGTYQDPIVVLHLNLPAPSWSSPSLLTPGMVENLFHEMGHALHSMLARTQYQHVTGTRCSTDFAEVPSILMEFFAMDTRVLSTFARHYKTGEPIPTELLERLVGSKSIFGASEMQLQTFYSLLDQRYHDTEEWPRTKSTTEILQEVQTESYSLPYVTNTAWQLRFGHLVGYGAKYYAYLVSRAVASWIWQKYFVTDPFSREMGEKYRREVLAHGGGKPPLAMVGEFLGREVSAEAMVEALMTDLDVKKQKVESVLRH